MKNIEDLLNKEKLRINKMKAPDELEAKLRLALAKQKKPKRKTQPLLLSIAVMFILMIGLNYNAFAYYGKKLLGFDEIMNETLKELNEKGMGQEINKTLLLEDGTTLTLDGIMSDENALILYYTLKNDKPIENALDIFSPQVITGLFTKSHASYGSGVWNDEKTEFKGMYTFDPVNPFAKSLTLHFHHLNGEQASLRDYQITFDYNPSESMATQLKKKIKETVIVDTGEIQFKTLTATPTMTILSGKMNVENFDRFNLGWDGVKLIVNGETFDVAGSSTSSSLFGYNFDIQYDALPEKIDSLEVWLQDFIGYKNINQTIEITNDENQEVNLDGYTLQIKNVETKDDRVEITIITEDSILLDGENITINVGDEEIPLEKTVGHIWEENNGKSFIQRTLVFKTSKEPISLKIPGIHYIKNYNIKINIPIE